MHGWLDGWMCLSRACGSACIRGFFPWLRPVRPHVCPLLRGGRGPHARAVRGRYIYGTKVKALPESLGQCKLLEELCVQHRRAAAVRVRGGAGAALPRVRCRAGRWGRTMRHWIRRRRRCRSSAAAEPVRARLARAADRRAVGVDRSRPARPHGGRAGTRATPSSRRCRRRSSGRA